MQSRYAMDDDRNTQRMRRQQIFLNAFMKKIKKQNAGDVNATVKLYDRLRPYATLSLDVFLLQSPVPEDKKFHPNIHLSV